MGTYIIVGIPAGSRNLRQLIASLGDIVRQKKSDAVFPKLPPHVTIVPPFEIDYGDAMNISRSLMTDFHVGPQNNMGSAYLIYGIDWFSFKKTDVLHLPVQLGDEFVSVAYKHRQLLKDKLKHKLSDSVWHPHFTIAEGVGLRQAMGETFSTNPVRRPVRGVISQIVILAKYPDGYNCLGDDPDRPIEQ